jgi:aspartate/methionine/tyrosine aminotransferase
MKLRDFKLEVFFGKYEFTAPYLLAQSDCETMSVSSLLSMEPGSETEFLNGRLGYTEVTGDPELRYQISQLYSHHTKDNIIVHTGAQEAIFNFMNVFLEKGDHVICQFPVYQSIYSIAEDIGCDISRWELTQTETGWAMDLDELESFINPNTKLICINNPNNPTGFIFTEDEMKKIAEIARRYGIFVFCDEVYKGLELDDIARPWFADIYDTALSLGVMSKAYGLPGLRIGWIATKDKIILDKMTKMKHFTSICNSATSEFLSIVALKHGDDILQKNKKIIRDNLKLSDRFFAQYKNLFRYNKQMAGPIAFHEVKIKTPVTELSEDMVEKCGVLLLPATAYDYPQQYFRMGYGRINFGENLKVLEKYLKTRLIVERS